MAAPLPKNETERLRTLRGLEILDTGAEVGFDILAQAAQKTAATEIALVSLVDDNRQWFKAKVGLSQQETPRDHAFCAHAILQEQTFCVEDATLDERFRDNPLVTGAPGIRAYAGAPIMIDGHAVGTVCAISTRPSAFPAGVRLGLEQIAAAAAERMVISRHLHIQSRLLQGAGDALIQADGEGRIIFWNTAAVALFGYSADEAKSLNLSDLLPERLRAQHQQAIAHIRAGGVNAFEGKPVELLGRHKDGSEIPVELTLSLWREGSERGYGAILRDCRERRALKEARAFSRAADRFLANMSHEIRTPLNGLLGLAQALEQTGLKEEQAQMVRLIGQSGLTLQRVLGDVLDSARMRSGDPEIRLEPCELSRIIRDVAALHAPCAHQKGLDYDIRAPAEPIWVVCDATRVTQILSNLLANAIKFTTEGSVRLVSESTAEGVWRFEVQDTGPGFSPAAAEQIFERFRQEDETITKRFGGTGLGLSIAREFARALGGDVEGSSAPEVGSTFTLTLPLASCAPPAADEPMPTSTPPETGIKILLAEDHPTNRMVVELLLAPIGARLTMVENGALAVDAFEQESFDVVLMDMHMPVMDGLTAIAAIRKLEQASGARPVRIVTLTANAFEEHARAARAAGADAHLTKPIVAAALLDALSPPN